MTTKRLGLWATNGHPGQTIDQMLGWNPGSLTCFYDYLAANRVKEYKNSHPDTTIIVRFQHDMNWWQNPQQNAINKGREVASKWGDLKDLDPYIYFCNEMNLHYENGDPYAGNQWQYETSAFYAKYADWVRMTAAVIKDIAPDMRLVTPPFAFGHNEDGEPIDGVPKLNWAGYDYLADTVRDYFDNVLTFHAYWGDGGGEKPGRLYDPDLSSWYAFRWRRVLDLFRVRYNNPDVKMIIDEAGNFQAGSPTFTDQLLYFGRECLGDKRVEAVTLFLWFDPTNSPGNVPNSWVQKMTPERLTAHLAALASFEVDDGGEVEPPIEPPQPPVECPDFSGAVSLLDEGLAGLAGAINNLGELTF